MNSIILSTATRFLLPLLLLFSVFLLLRGHNAPGGGFAGGLVVAGAWTLYAIAQGLDDARRLLGVEPRKLITAGLLVAIGSAMFGPLAGEPFMTGQWWELSLPILKEVHLGTPLLFDVGVYLVVIGVTITVLMTLIEE